MGAVREVRRFTHKVEEWQREPEAGEVHPGHLRDGDREAHELDDGAADEYEDLLAERVLDREDYHLAVVLHHGGLAVRVEARLELLLAVLLLLLHEVRHEDAVDEPVQPLSLGFER